MQNLIGSMPKVVLAGEEPVEVDGFNFSGSCIARSSQISDEVCSHGQKARLTFKNVKHVCSRLNIRLPIKGQIRSALWCVLIYGSESWPLREELQ